MTVRMMVTAVVLWCILSLLHFCTSVSLPWNDDVLGLIVFKADLHDPHSFLTTWNEDDSSPCNWAGIRCNPNTGRVSGIFLDGFSLSGPFGRALLKLDQIESISLSHNNLSGTLFNEISSLQLLKNLSLNHNALQGIIPSSLGNLSSLQFLDLGYNVFSGNLLPEMFDNCSRSLRYVSFARNQLDGQFPNSIANCRGLNTLDISYNRFTGFLPNVQTAALNFMDVSHNSISGSIPSYLGRLSNLSELRIQSNLLSGEFPVEVMQLLQLSKLNASRNGLSGSVPNWVWNLTQLQEVDLSSNQLTGPIPEIGSCQSLQSLYLSNNKMEGNIPQSLIRCSMLSNLHLSGNNFSGIIPSELFELDLQTLFLSKNSFSGGFPIFSPLVCSSLENLDFSQNLLDGEIPSHIAQCPHLQLLDLSHNSFVGTIPVDIGSMTALTTLDLSNNQLQGYVPESFAHAASLAVLHLKANFLVGEIPDDLANCTSLKELDLSFNNLTGGLPAALAQLSNLIIFDVSSNRLTGEIPSDFGQQQSLRAFNVSHNSLGGPVPSEGVFQMLDSSSFTGNVHLCGAPLEVECPVIPKPVVLNPNATNEDGMDPIISGQGHQRKKIVLSYSAIVAISAAAFIALGITVVSLLNIKALSSGSKRFGDGGGGRRAASFFVVDSIPGTPSEDLEVGKLVMFTDDSSDGRDEEEDLLPTAQALLNKNGEIGRGSFGIVYRAVLGSGKVVAVKKLTQQHQHHMQSQHEFEKQVRSLGRIQHPNLVTFQGYYWTPKLQLLIYDYIGGGNLYGRIHDGGGGEALLWSERLKIAIGIASGLAYLHHKCRPRVIHMSVKSSNVLVDEEGNARVCDYGIAQLVPGGRERYVMGNKALGYVAPEFAFASMKMSEKCDVYGFGVILLELISGKRPVEYLEDDVVVLCDYVRALVDEGKALSCVDLGLGVDYPEDEVLTVIKLGLICTSHVPSNRPSMNEVVQILELIKPLADARDSL